MTGGCDTRAMIPPADMFLRRISCWFPDPSIILPTRSIAEMRSSSRRSTGRGTAVDSETVVDSNAASTSDWVEPADFLRISDENMLPECLLKRVIRAKMGLYGQCS